MARKLTRRTRLRLMSFIIGVVIVACVSLGATSCKPGWGTRKPIAPKPNSLVGNAVPVKPVAAIPVISPKPSTPCPAPENENEELIKAIVSSDNQFAEAKRALDEGANASVQTSDCTPALNLAIMNGKTDIALDLIRRQANANAKDSMGRTSLMAIAYAKGNTEELIGPILENKADPEIRDNTGSTALCHAAYAGNLALIDALLEKKANINSVNGNSQSVLICATVGISYSRSLNSLKRIVANRASYINLPQPMPCNPAAGIPCNPGVQPNVQPNSNSKFPVIPNTGGLQAADVTVNYRNDAKNRNDQELVNLYEEASNVLAETYPEAQDRCMGWVAATEEIEKLKASGHAKIAKLKERQIINNGCGFLLR